MPPSPVLLDLRPETIGSLPCCGVKNAAHEGRRLKNCWLKAHFGKGLRAKVLMTPDNRPCGYIEYLPGGYAWRAVDAAGYMFIHCVWTFFKQYQHKGTASRMVQAVVEELGELLGQHFPRREDDTNELPDEVQAVKDEGN